MPLAIIRQKPAPTATTPINDKDISSYRDFPQAISLHQISSEARTRLSAEVTRWTEARRTRMEAGEEFDADTDGVTEPELFALRAGPYGATIGYMASIAVYRAGHDVGSNLYFNLAGEQIDEELAGELGGF